jgi:dimethylaniline monooxygenase (N-oxide forming)
MAMQETVQSSAMLSASGSRKPGVNLDYDPFGVKKAGAEALRPKSWWLKAGAKTANWLLILVAASPCALLFVLPITAVWHGRNYPAFVYLAIGFWVWFIAFATHQLRLFTSAPDPMIAALGRPAGRSDVVVIGAGPVGLAVVKECLEQGLNVQCFETKDGLGGVYRYDRVNPGGVYKTARLTSSPWVTAFSDFPPPSSSSTHYTHEEYLAYLEAYADHFHLKSRIFFRHNVVKLEPAEVGWKLTVRDDQSSDLRTLECARVAICAGLHQRGMLPALPGIDSFTGEIRHVASYKEASEYQGKTVVVSGLGESGADIAYELSSVASKTLLSIQRGKFVIPRVNPLTGMANDYDTNRIRNATPIYLRDSFMSLRRWLCSYMGKHSAVSAVRYRLLQVSETGATSQTATKSDDFVDAILGKKIELRHKISRFENDSVVFSDGAREAVDVILVAQGYRPEFPFLHLPAGTEARHPSRLFVHMFHPDIGDSLAFCGFARPAIGAIPPVGELQARLFAQLAAGHRVLPGKAEMLKGIEFDLRRNAARFPKLDKENTVIAWIPYMDRLAGLIGCRPDPWKLLRSPVLMWKVAAGATTGAQYRLHGTGAAEVARKTVLSMPRGHGLAEVLAMLGLHFWSWPLGLIRRDVPYSSDVSVV